MKLMFRHLVVFVAGACACALATLGMLHLTQPPELPALRELAVRWPWPFGQSSSEGMRFDGDLRLVAARGKVFSECPKQDATTAVILTAGQSNAANHAGQKYISRHPGQVLSFFDGKCTAAKSPLLGATGRWGEPWTPLGDRLIESAAFERVIFVPTAIGGSSIARWSQGGDLNIMLRHALANVQPHLRITHVLWQQGESDFQFDTSAEHWRSGFGSMLRTLRDNHVDAPVFVAVSTRCDNAMTNWAPDNPIARAQRAVVDESQFVQAGVDADSLLTGMDRYDDCHLSASGIDKLVNGWANAIKSVQRNQVAR